MFGKSTRASKVSAAGKWGRKSVFCVDNVSMNCGVKFEVLDPDINFSDHLPLLAIISCPNFDRLGLRGNRVSSPEMAASRPTQLRWDHGNISSYYHYTGCYLTPISDDLDNVLSPVSYTHLTLPTKRIV